MKNWMRLGVVFMGAVFLNASCIDKDYDLNHVDLTIGLGNEGLGVKVGETEKIYLENILEVDNTVKLDENNLYYLVEDGTSAYDFQVDKVTTTLQQATVETKYRVLSFEDALEQNPEVVGMVDEFEVSTDFAPSGHAEGENQTDITIDDISSDVKSLQRIYTNDLTIGLTMQMLTSPGIKFGIHSYKDFKITVPAYLHISQIFTPGWTLTGNVLHYKGEKLYDNEEICTIKVDYIDLHEYGHPVNATIVLGEEMVKAKIEGEIKFKTREAFTMRKGDYADIKVGIIHNNGRDDVTIDAVTGRFAPNITVAPQHIDIASSLPDFLQDDEVRVNVTNPTIKLSSDMTQLPLGINISAQLNAIKNGNDGFNVPVSLPVVAADNNVFNTIYYYQGNAPYDPEGVVAQAKTQQVDNLSTLLFRLPDYINVDFDGGKVSVQDKDYTIELGKTYNTAIDYKIYVPFEFSEGLTIVYNDSTDSFEDDLADYTAEGLTVQAEAYNSIPLDLVAEIYAVDIHNNRINEINFDKALIAPSKDGQTEQRTDVTISARLNDPYLLQKIDRLFFKIRANSGVSETPHQLMSTQYLQFKEIKLRLDGQVTGNFN